MDDVGKIDIFACGPSCKDVSTRNADPKPACYEPDAAPTGTSGPTYKKGFYKAVEVLQPKLAFYENVIAVLHASKKSPRPAIQVVIEDMRTLGYIFAHLQVDSQDFLVRQRRNRVWGVATPQSGGLTQANVAKMYEAGMSHLASIGTRFPRNVLFDENAPMGKITNATLQQHVDQALGAALLSGRSDDIYVDDHTSPQGVAPCGM